MPFRKTLIVGLIALAVAAYIGSRHFDDEERRPGYEAILEAIQEGRVPEITLGPAQLRSYSNPPYLPSTDPVAGPVAPPTMGVSLDPAGRPYDQALPPGARLERRPVAVVHAPTRKVLLMAGEETPNPRPGLHRPIRLASRPGNRYPVDAIWLDDGGVKTIVGVVLIERDSRVVRWRETRRLAYTTYAGFGGITTPEWSVRPKGFENPVERLYWDRLFGTTKRQAGTADADGVEGTDTVIFRSGLGTGSFPLFGGYDAAGRRAQIVLRTGTMPWRAAFPTGTPPAAVTRREKQFRSCLRGRLLDGHRCVVVR